MGRRRVINVNKHKPKTKVSGGIPKGNVSNKFYTQFQKRKKKG
jgi:hypothetical protein